MSEQQGLDDIGRNTMSLVVRLIGFCLLLAGVWIAFEVMLEALHLYREPQRIEKFARAIEQGSNIDKSLVSFRKAAMSEPGDQEGLPAQGSVSENFVPSSDIRVSYFFAWMIVLLLMLLIARISLAAVKTGGELVLYDMQIKQFARSLVRESSRSDR